MFAFITSECTGDCSFAQQYFGLLTDVPHLLFEVTLTLIQDGVIGLLLWPFIKRVYKKRQREEHLKQDEEHGIIHTERADA